jgi:hypothetical protein
MNKMIEDTLCPTSIRWICVVFFLIAQAATISTGTGKDVMVEIHGQVKDVAFADLNGDQHKDLVVTAASETHRDGVAPVQVYLQRSDGSYLEAGIPGPWMEDVFQLDLGNFTSKAGEEMLLFGERAVHLVEFDEQGQPSRCRGYAPLAPLFHACAHDAPQLLHLSVDIDANGYEDAILPVPDGYAVLFSRGTAPFEDPMILPVTCTSSIQFSDNTLFSLMTMTSKIHILQRSDALPMLVAEMGGKLTAFQFRPESRDFLHIESQRSDLGSYANLPKEGTVEYAGILFSDDLRADFPSFVHTHREGRAGILAHLKTTHTVYEFEKDLEMHSILLHPRQRIATAGISAAPIYSDLNADGYKDLVLLYVKTSFLSKVIEMLTDRVVITCQAHLFQPEEGRYSFTPDWSEEFAVPVKSFRTVGGEGLVRFDGDFNQDGRPDIMVYQDDRLLIKRGEKDEGFFSTQEVSFKSKPFYQVGGPFPGPVFCTNVDRDEAPEIVTFGQNIVRIVHVE